MVRRLPTPRTPADEYAAASYELLGQLVSAVGNVHQLLRDRLPSPTEVKMGPVAGPVRLTEPAVVEPLPVLPEPDPPAVEPEPAAEPSPAPRPVPPPRSGRGSSLPAWQTFADGCGVAYAPDDSRDDIIAACGFAGVLDGK